jgi:hypothetical protein
MSHGDVEILSQWTIAAQSQFEGDLQMQGKWQAYPRKANFRVATRDICLLSELKEEMAYNDLRC